MYSMTFEGNFMPQSSISNQYFTKNEINNFVQLNNRKEYNGTFLHEYILE